MRIAVMSDLHVEFRKRFTGDVRNGFKLFCERLVLPETIDADVIVVAGDTHPKKSKRTRLLDEMGDHYRVPIIHVDGNHDYYGSRFPEDVSPIKSVIDTRGESRTFIYATAWSYLRLSDVPPPWSSYGISDTDHIKQFSVESWTRTHQRQIDDLLSDRYDVVITHHALSNHSIVPIYKDNPLNPFFVTNYTPIIEQFKTTKLMIHGHTHSKLDYMLGQCRVVCNPLGYPTEMYSSDYDFEPLIVEV